MTAIEMRCETCKHWDASDVDYSPRRGWGACTRAETYGGEPVHADTLMVARDPEFCVDYVLTKPNFGCVMYEPRADVALPEAVARRVNATWTWEAGEND